MKKSNKILLILFICLYLIPVLIYGYYTLFQEKTSTGISVRFSTEKNTATSTDADR